jgi:hypothetical protein
VMGAGRPAAPTVRVFDMDGQPRDLAWVQQKYGSFLEFAQPAGGGIYRIVELREHSGPASIDVYVLDENGAPMPNVMIRFEWPGDGVEQPTEADGKRGFGLGPGTYILDAHVGGACCISVISQYPSDRARNMGHLAGTPHDHIDVVYQLVHTGS